MRITDIKLPLTVFQLRYGTLSDLRGGAWRAHAPPLKMFKVCMTVDELIYFT